MRSETTDDDARRHQRPSYRRGPFPDTRAWGSHDAATLSSKATSSNARPFQLVAARTNEATPRSAATLVAAPLAIFLLSAILLSIATSTAHASSGHITLLTVDESEEQVGGAADLYLTIKPGTGSVYMDSFPLTRIDTQSSIRYANRVACDLLQKDCSRYDFFYKIRASSSIIGGPSAGAAITVLTVAVLDGQDIDQRLAMTGTVNSGGIIGPVAGVRAKVDGARQAGFTTVLIPALTPADEIFIQDRKTVATDGDDERDDARRDVDEDGDNVTDDARRPPAEQEPLRLGRIDAISDDNLAVIGVGTIEEALLYATGKEYSRPAIPLQVPAEYERRMRSITDEICDRTTELENVAEVRRIIVNDTNNYTARIAAVPDGHAYSEASLCFSRNIELATAVLENTSAEERRARFRELETQLEEFSAVLDDKTISTIGDLETYAIVRERVNEARELLDEAKDGPERENDAEDGPDASSLAYAQERLRSAKSWSIFFGMPGRAVKLDDDHLRIACLAKLAEAEERVNYVRLYAPRMVVESDESLQQARASAQHEPILCIFSASKATAQADVISSALTIGEANVDALIQQKLDADMRMLQRQQEEGFFPILGYSYTQYAQDLRVTTPYSALLFSEYALELSNLGLYFPRPDRWRMPMVTVDIVIIFLLGALAGAAVVLFIIGKSRQRRMAQPNKTQPSKAQQTGRATATPRKNVERKKRKKRTK